MHLPNREENKRMVILILRRRIRKSGEGLEATMSAALGTSMSAGDPCRNIHGPWDEAVIEDNHWSGEGVVNTATSSPHLEENAAANKS